MIASELSASIGLRAPGSTTTEASDTRGVPNVPDHDRQPPAPHSTDTYREATAAITIGMRDRLYDVVLRLVGRLDPMVNDGRLTVP